MKKFLVAMGAAAMLFVVCGDDDSIFAPREVFFKRHPEWR